MSSLRVSVLLGCLLCLFATPSLAGRRHKSKSKTKATPAPTEEESCLEYVGSVFSPHTGWDCDEGDAAIDLKLDTACNNLYPGSRSVTGDEIMNGGYLLLDGLVDEYSSAFGSFLAKCPGCGESGSSMGCDGGDGRLRVEIFTSEEWNEYPDGWDLHTNANSLAAVCVEDTCDGDLGML